MFTQFKFSNFKVYTGELNDKGQLCNMYQPLQNLAAKTTHILGDFSTSSLDFDLLHPVDIVVQDSYDGAVNLIINDGKNIPRLINTRFSVQDENTFKIPDHSGFKDTNIYEDDTFDVDTALKAIPIKIPKISYDGLIANCGNMQAGAYTFFFKLCDADGNETEVVAESGVVQCHIGNVCTQSKNGIRMGLQDENTGKAIKFTLTEINAGFDFIKVLYARESSGQNQASQWTYKEILFNYPVDNTGRCEILITGNYPEISISENDIKIDYADINSALTQTVCNNLLLFGNITGTEHDWDAIKQFTWKIIPEVVELNSIGTLNSNYQEAYSTTDDQRNFKQCYYNTRNVYYRLGYWPDEIYRFGIVYIFEDNSLSKVINLQGVNFDLTDGIQNEEFVRLFFEPVSAPGVDTKPNWLYETDDGWFRKEYGTNAYGVIKFPHKDVIEWKDNCMQPKPIGIQFNFEYIGYENAPCENNIYTDWKEVLKKHKIKGYFFVRQKRVPTILGQGLVIGHTCKDYGSLPILRNSSGDYVYQSFLTKGDRILQSEPVDQTIKSVYIQNSQQLDFDPEYYSTHPKTIDNNALLFPDAEVMEATYNQIFTSSDFTLFYGKSSCSFYDSSTDHSFNIATYSSGCDNHTSVKLTNIPEDMKLLTNGSDYFSTLAGNPSEPFKTSNVAQSWKFTYPQNLTESNSLVRGKWGAYVGTSSHNIPYGTIVTVKLDKYTTKKDPWIEDFESVMFATQPFFPICHRTPINQWKKNIDNAKKITCARGDCFISMFTHRMFRNFIDPELPTNTDIIDPVCFRDNYAVRCTTTVLESASSNLAKEHEGWSIPTSQEDEKFQTIVYFLTGNVIGGLMSAIKDATRDSTENATFAKFAENGPYANEIVQSYEVYNRQDIDEKTAFLTPITSLVKLIYNKMNDGTKRKLKPKGQETNKGFSIKALFTPDDLWELHGLASINRADVNAVGLGQWITFPILSNKNLAFRDVDFSNATEEASFNQKRGFFPHSGKNVHLPLRDSNVINQATGISLIARDYEELPKVPYIKQEFFTRVTNSLMDSAKNFTNEFKVILQNAYKDYTKVYGSITKLVTKGNNVFIIFKHGIGVLNVAEGISNAVQSKAGPEEYLPNISIISDTYGTIWKDSILDTPNGIYGVDSVAKVIWLINGTEINIISDLSANQKSSVQKYLNDTLDMSEFEFRPFIGHINIKTHYNAFKHDVIFTYYNDILYAFNSKDDSTIKDYYVEIDGETAKAYYKDFNGKSYRYGDVTPVRLLPEYDTAKQAWQSYEDVIRQQEDLGKIVRWAKGTTWSLCYNEDLKCFQTFYDWIPLESENIGNVFFSFDKDAMDEININFSKYMLEPTQSEQIVKRKRQHKNVEIDHTFTNDAYIYICDNKFQQLIPNTRSIKASTLRTINLLSSNDILSINVPEQSTAYYTISFYARLIEKAKDDLEFKFCYYFQDNSNNKCPVLTRKFNLDKDCNWRFYYTAISIENKDIGTKSGKEVLYIEPLSGISDAIYLSEVKFQPCSQEQFKKYKIKSGNNLNCVTQDTGFYPLDTYDIRNSSNSFYLWKHGQAGVYDNQGEILPTVWYGKQHEFNFEFIVNEKPQSQKIFNNLQLISNKTPMLKIEYELPGEGYDWYKYKQLIYWLNKAVEKEIFGVSCTLEDAYKDILSHTYNELCDDIRYTDCPLDQKLFNKNSRLPRLPFLPIVLADRKGLPEKTHGYNKESYWENKIKAEQREGQNNDYLWNTSDAIIVYDKQLNEYRIHTEQYCNDVEKYGRVRGNAQYLEDAWRIEMRPIPIRYYSLDEDTKELKKEVLKETRQRDKYIKVKIRYSGKDLAIIQAVTTLFHISKA